MIIIFKDNSLKYVTGVLFSNGEGWKAQRRFTLHHFRDLGFGKRSHESVILEEAEYLVKKLLEEGGKPVDIKVSYK